MEPLPSVTNSFVSRGDVNLLKVPENSKEHCGDQKTCKNGQHLVINKCDYVTHPSSQAQLTHLSTHFLYTDRLQAARFATPI